MIITKTNKTWQAAAAILLLVGAGGCQQLGIGGGNAQGGNQSSNKSGSSDADKPGEGGNSSRSEDRDDRRGNDSRSSDNGAREDRSSDRRGGSDDYDRRVRVVNNSNQTIAFLYGSPTSDNEWGRDRIPTMTLSAGSSAFVDFDDGNGECRYDLRVVFDDQTSREERNIDICEIREWTLTASGSSVR